MARCKWKWRPVANCSSTYSLHFLITSTISLANHHARSGYLPHSLSRLPVRQTIIAPMALAHVVCWHARPHSQDRVSAHALFFLYIYFVRALPFSVCGVFVVRNSAIVSLCSSLPALDALASLYSAARDLHCMTVWGFSQILRIINWKKCCMI